MLRDPLGRGQTRFHRDDAEHGGGPRRAAPRRGSRGSQPSTARPGCPGVWGPGHRSPPGSTHPQNWLMPLSPMSPSPSTPRRGERGAGASSPSAGQDPGTDSDTTEGTAVPTKGVPAPWMMVGTDSPRRLCPCLASGGGMRWVSLGKLRHIEHATPPLPSPGSHMSRAGHWGGTARGFGEKQSTASASAYRGRILPQGPGGTPGRWGALAINWGVCTCAHMWCRRRTPVAAHVAHPLGGRMGPKGGLGTAGAVLGMGGPYGRWGSGCWAV